MKEYLNKKQEQLDWEKLEAMGWASAQSYLRDAILDLHERVKILEKLNENKQRSTEDGKRDGAGKYVPKDTTPCKASAGAGSRSTKN